MIAIKSHLYFCAELNLYRIFRLACPTTNIILRSDDKFMDGTWVRVGK